MASSTSAAAHRQWIDEVIRIAEERFDFLRLTFADMHGISRGKLIPRQHFADKLKNGTNLVAGSLGFGPRIEIIPLKEHLETNYTNGVLRPMPGTLHALPWAAGGKHRIGEVLCEMSWVPHFRDGAPVAACTRYIARTQLQRLESLGYQLLSAFEEEFFAYRRDSSGELRLLFDGCDLYSTLLMSEYEEFMCSMSTELLAAGVDLVTLHAEHGDGQFEFSLEPKCGIEAADQTFNMREGVKEICILRDFQASFMSNVGGESNVGQHFNHSLWKGEQNAFYDATCSDSHKLSAVGRHWIAGLRHHSKALTALCCPTVNCYRRLHEMFAPDVNDCGVEDRTAMLRVVTTSPHSTYIENRLPSAAANPYLAIAATVAAGIDGLEKRMELPADTGKDMSERLPLTLAEALDALEADKVLVNALGEEFVRWFVTVKREVDIAKLDKAKEDGIDPMEVERELYFKYV